MQGVLPNRKIHERVSLITGALSPKAGCIFCIDVTYACDLCNEPAMLQSESKETSNNVTLQCFLSFLHVAVCHTGTVQVDGPAFAGFKNLATHEELGPWAMHGNCNRVQCDRGDYQNVS